MPTATEIQGSVDISQFYWIIGAMIVMNLGTIVTIIISAARGVWFLAQLDAKVSQNRKDLNAAHVKIRQLEGLDRGL